ncbi:MAG: hypothetical protein ACYDAL_09755 [Candidatus Dormibacteraceae bacterium]
MFKAFGKLAVGAVALVALAACDPPFGLGQPSIRALDGGAAASLDSAKSFRLAGSYAESGSAWKVDLELVRPATAHVLLSGPNDDLAAIIITDQGSYFRGQRFLSDHMGSDPLARALVRATGNSWWTGLSATAPEFPDFTKGSGLAATFLGTAVTSRADHVLVGGVQTVQLSGPRADVFVAEAPPYRVVRIHTKRGAVVDGISDADFRYSDFDQDFGIAAPAGAVNFADLSTLPPVYTVESVDTSGCASTCVVAASLKNLGGRNNAKAASTVTFTMTDPQTNGVVGKCTVTVQPDVVHSALTNVSCTISGVNGGDHNAAVVTAAADNPGRA